MANELTQTKGPPKVDAVGRAIRSLVLRSIALALMPAIVTFSWVAFLREPALRVDAVQDLSSELAAARANLLADYINDAVQRVERLAAELPQEAQQDGAIDPVANGFPDASDVLVLSLDELGTVNLEPGKRGIESHITIDVVRRAFAEEEPPPEFVLRPDSAFTLVARPYGAPKLGVLLVKLSGNRIESILGGSEAGQFTLVQQLSGEGGKPVAGNRAAPSPIGSAPVPGAPWQVTFSPSAGWLKSLLPDPVPLFIGVGVALLGFVAGAAMLLIGIPRQLRQLAPAAKAREPDPNPEKNNRDKEPMAKAPAAPPPANPVTSSHEANEPAREPSEPPPPAEEPNNQTPDDVPAATESFAEHLFSPAGIQGDTGTELSDELIEKIGCGLAVLAKERGVTAFAIARDNRPTSPGIQIKLMKALLASGLNIVDLGEAPAPILHYATHETEAASGIMITGGQGPETVNGLEIYLNRHPIDPDDMVRLLELVKQEARVEGTGTLNKEALGPAYLDQMAVDIALALPLKIVLDNNFGTAALLGPELFESLDCEVVSINEPSDGARSETWQLEAALTELGARVQEEGADIGILFDGNGDRLHTVTERGEPVATDRLMMLLGRDLLERNPGSDIIYDVRFTRNFAPFIARNGGRALMSPSGLAQVSATMRKSGALLGGEFSGHVLFKERWFGFADGLYAAARLLELLSGASASYGELIEDLPAAVFSPELRLALPAAQQEKVLKDLADNANFPQARVTTLDGVRVDYSDSWGLVRRSTSGSALSFRFEGNDESSLERVRAVLRKAILAVAPELELPF